MLHLKKLIPYQSRNGHRSASVTADFDGLEDFGELRSIYDEPEADEATSRPRASYCCRFPPLALCLLRAHAPDCESLWALRGNKAMDMGSAL
jgi:hypothetical protein